MEDAFINDVALEAMGQDPGQAPPISRAAVLHPEVMIAQEVLRMSLREDAKQQVLAEGGWDQIKAYRNGLVQQWAERRKERAAVDPEGQAMQMAPLEVDPNEVANMRGMTAKLHNALRAAGFEEGIYADPELARVAQVFSQTQGIVQEGEQPYHPAYMDAPIGLKQLGWLGTEVVGPAVAGVAEVGFNTGYGLAQLGTMAFEGLTGQDVQHTLPTVVIEDDNGNIVHNGGKLPSGMELIGAAYAAATGAEIEETMKQVGLADQYAALRREGIDAVVAPVSQFVGSVAGFAQPGGWAMAGGQALLKGGFTALAGAERIAALSPWAKRLVNVVANTGGAAFGNAMFMGVAYGHHEGYGNAMLEGATVTPVILGLGAMGRGAEKYLRQAKMPAPVARAISGAMEGAGFGLWQLATEDEAFHGAEELWSLIKDPSEGTWQRWSQVMTENVLGMMMFKTAFGVTPGQFALDRMQGLPGEVTQARVREEGFQRQLSREARGEFGEAGRAVRARGELEAELEGRGVTVPQEGELGAQQAHGLLDRLMGLTQRRTGKGMQEVGAAASTEGVVRVSKGGGGTASVSATEAKTGAPPGESIGIHTHPTPTTFSGQDFIGTLLRKPVGGQPELLVTPETVWSARRVREPSGSSVDPEAIDRTWNTQTGPAAAAEVARRRGLDADAVWEAWTTRSESSGRVEPALREAAREVDAELNRYMQRAGAKLGLEIEQLSPAEARERWSSYLETGEWGPRKAPASGVSRGTLVALGERMAEGVPGAEEPLRTQARLEGAGRYPEPPQARQERLYERVSARGEFPAEGAQATPEGVPGTEPIHARDVIAEGQVGPIAPAVRQGVGAQLKRWVRGYFSTREDLMRMEGARDLNNFAHEWGHALWEKLGGRMGLSGRAKAQLLEVGRPTSTPRMRTDQRLHEGMAEFVARHLLGDAELGTRHPELYREVMDFMTRPEQVEAMEQFGRLERAFARWRDQGMDAQVEMSWVSADEPMTTQQAQLELGKPIKKMSPLVKARVGWQRAVTAFEHAMVDDLARVKRSMKNALSKAGLHETDIASVLDNPVKMMETLRGKSGAVMETFLFRHAIGFAHVGQPRGMSMREALSGVKPEERRKFVSYLVARRNLEALDKGMIAQLSRDHYLGYIERHGNDRFERAAQGLKSWFDNLIQYAVEGGALTEDAGKAIKGSWTVYVPFFRALSGPRQQQPGRGVAERGSGVQRMKRGSEYEIRDPLEAALEVGQSIIQKAHQAASMKAFYNLHLTTKGMGRFVTEVQRDVEARRVTFDDLATALERLQFPGDIQHVAETFADALRDLSVEDAQAVITMFTQRTIPKGHKARIAFVPRYTEAEIGRFAPEVQAKLRAENGKLKWLELDTDTYEAVMNIDPATHLQHPILRALAMPTQWVKFGATAINPDFMARNIIRDTILNSLFTDVQNRRRFVPVLGAATNFVEGLTMQLKGDPAAEIHRDIGGLQATFFGRELGLASKQVHNPKGPAEAYRKVLAGLALPEATLRVREFKGIRDKALAEGKTELEANLEALHAAQEVSVNFIRGGAVARSLNHWIPYFNPGIQGNRKFLRAVLGYEGKGKQKQAIAQGLANVTVPSFMLWMLYKDEEWYQDLPVWRRNNYWTFEVPFSNGELVSVPKPFEAGKIFGNIPEWLLSQISGEPIELSELGWDVFANFLNGFDWMPATFGPIAEATMNYSLFKGRELIPHWMEEGRIPEDQYTSYSTGLARWLGKAFNISPIKVEHVAGGYSGGLGLRAMRALDVLIGGPTQTVDPGVGISDIPFVGTFFKQEPHKQSAFVQRVYDLHRELTQLAGSEKLSPAQAGMQAPVRAAKEMISNVKRLVREGRLSAEEGDRRAYEIARPVIEAYRRVTQ